MKTYKIRFNTSSIETNSKWRVISEDGDENFVQDVFIDGQAYTTKDNISGLGYKYHITCKGICTISNNIAYIRTPPKESALTRHILKTISYRFLGTLTTVFTAYLLGAPLALASLLGVGELIIKPFIYFIHERIWYKFIKLK